MIILRADKLQLVEPNHELMNRPPKLYDFENEKDSAPGVASVLYQKMKDLGGIGLSANQLGLDLRVFVMGSADTGTYIFNPEILGQSDEEDTFREGCLSYPGIFLYMKRPLSIRAKYFNEKGEEKITNFSGLTARIFQHEYDHMMGTDFTKNVSKLKLDLAKKKFANARKKLIKKHARKTIIGAINESAKSTGV
ncbi:MAG: peptide deformylase [Proteobacteria bacterium]|nr:peptide deformylase [Pseudomonadota bacterium]NBP14483.1 peptide deformylase [bacterium]